MPPINRFLSKLSSPQHGRTGTSNNKLIQCHDCGADISKKAQVCPSCGVVTRYGKKQNRQQKKRNALRNRGNTQGCGCLLIILAFIGSITIIGAPIAIPLGAIGVIILLLGLFPVF